MPSSNEDSKNSKDKLYEKYMTVYLDCEEKFITFQIP